MAGSAPEDVLERIFSYLSLDDIIHCSEVNRKWRETVIKGSILTSKNSINQILSSNTNSGRKQQLHMYKLLTQGSPIVSLIQRIRPAETVQGYHNNSTVRRTLVKWNCIYHVALNTNGKLHMSIYTNGSWTELVELEVSADELWNFTVHLCIREDDDVIHFVFPFLTRRGKLMVKLSRINRRDPVHFSMSCSLCIQEARPGIPLDKFSIIAASSDGKQIALLVHSRVAENSLYLIRRKLQSPTAAAVTHIAMPGNQTMDPMGYRLALWSGQDFSVLEAPQEVAFAHRSSDRIITGSHAISRFASPAALFEYFRVSAQRNEEEIVLRYRDLRTSEIQTEQELMTLRQSSNQTKQHVLLRVNSLICYGNLLFIYSVSFNKRSLRKGKVSRISMVKLSAEGAALAGTFLGDVIMPATFTLNKDGRQNLESVGNFGHSLVCVVSGLCEVERRQALAAIVLGKSKRGRTSSSIQPKTRVNKLKQMLRDIADE